jgi:hypothetical protein
MSQLNVRPSNETPSLENVMVPNSVFSTSGSIGNYSFFNGGPQTSNPTPVTVVRDKNIKSDASEKSHVSNLLSQRYKLFYGAVQHKTP